MRLEYLQTGEDYGHKLWGKRKKKKTCVNTPRQKVNSIACKLLPPRHRRHLRTIGSAVAWWLPLFKWKCRSPLLCQVPPKQCTNYSLQGIEEKKKTERRGRSIERRVDNNRICFLTVRFFLLFFYCNVTCKLAFKWFTWTLWWFPNCQSQLWTTVSQQ